MKRKAFEEIPGPSTKKGRRYPEPIHERRLFVKATVTWTSLKGEIKTHEGMFLADSGCSGATMNKTVVNRERMTVIKRAEAISISTADGSEMKEAGVYYTPPYTMRIGSHQEEISWEVATLEDGVSGYLPISWLAKHNPDIDWEKRIIKWRSLHCKQHCLPMTSTKEVMEYVCQILEGAMPEAASALWHDDQGNDITASLPEEYWPWASVFSEEEIRKLPEHTKYDHEINLMPGKTAPFGPIYPLSEKELLALREYLKPNLEAGKVRRSSSSAGAPIIFVPKKDGSLRLCVDYRGLNKVTIKDRTPLPLMTELRERLAKAKWFTLLDLKNGYNLIRIKEGDEWKTAFRTRYGLFEYTVMPFGLCNAPGTFQSMINDVLRDLLDAGTVVYIDDILIYSENEEEHKRLVKEVLTRLKQAGLCASLAKSKFHVQEVEYLGYHISSKGISMSEKKVATIQDWTPPKKVKDVQSFLGFANFYRRFIEGFSKVCRPLTELTKNTTQYIWSEECQQSFDLLKRKFMQAPILVHFFPNRPTIVETDASDFALGAILSQEVTKEDGSGLHPVAFHSRKFKPAEINYDIHDKELLAIVVAFKEWEHMLKSTESEITVFTDHKNLEYFATTKVLTRRQARWAEHLAEYDFKVVYRPGSKNVKADMLSRHWDNAPKEGSEAPQMSFFRPGQLVINTAIVSGVRVVSLKGTFIERLKKAAQVDKDWQATKRAVLNQDPKVAPQFEVHGELLLYENRWVIPNDPDMRLAILEENHDSKVAGHFGQHKTYEKMTQNFFWSKMENDVRDYVRSCDVCQRDKSSRHKKYGLLQPLEIPYRPWDCISMDFIVALPESEGYDKIWVIVDRLTKMAHFIPLKSGSQSPVTELAKAFAKEVWRLHGLPSEILSDRDTQFTSGFWTELMVHLDIKLKLSTAFRPQTDGQTEIVNQVLEQYLRHFCNYQQDDWVELLPFAEYAHNTAVSEATKTSPFYANYGYQPETQWVGPKQGEEWANPASELLLSRWKGIWGDLQANIKRAQEKYARYYDRKVMEPPAFKIGDLVMIDARNLKTQRPSKKLDHKKIGPVKILKKIGTRAYRVELPPTIKVHNVFHVSLMEPYRTSKFPNRRQSPPPSEEVEGEASWEVESVADSRYHKGRKRVEYLVFWKGYPPEQASWEPWESLEGTAEESLKKFHKESPSKPRHKRV
jgi:hypothetical protein